MNHDKAVDTLNRLIERVVAGGVASLTPEERRIFMVNEFLFRFENGGLSGLLYNISPAPGEPWAGLSELISAVASFGREDVAQALRDVLEIVGSGSFGEGSWGDFIASRDPDGRLDAVDARLSEISDGLWSDIEAAALLLPD